MRRIGLAILGFALGVASGLVATLTAIWLWFDVLGQGADTPKPGLGVLFTLGPVLMIGGGIATAWWLVRRDGRGERNLVLALLGAVSLLLLVGYIGPLVGLF